jgi:PleD family two-component response regulator
MRMLFMGESQARDAVRQAIEQAGSDDVPLIDVDTIEDILRVTKTEDRDVLVVQEGVTDVSTLMATLRGLSATNMLPVLSIQIESDPVAEERALNLGVNDVVDRGMPPAVILARIRRTLDTPAR